MIDFICSIFKSEETKTNEEYFKYRKKYEDRIQILEKGSIYIIEYLVLGRNKNFTARTGYCSVLNAIKKQYISICKKYELNDLPEKDYCETNS